MRLATPKTSVPALTASGSRRPLMGRRPQAAPVHGEGVITREDRMTRPTAPCPNTIARA